MNIHEVGNEVVAKYMQCTVAQSNTFPKAVLVECCVNDTVHNAVAARDSILSCACNLISLFCAKCFFTELMKKLSCVPT